MQPLSLVFYCSRGVLEVWWHHTDELVCPFVSPSYLAHFPFPLPQTYPHRHTKNPKCSAQSTNYSSFLLCLWSHRAIGWWFDGIEPLRVRRGEDRDLLLKKRLSGLLPVYEMRGYKTCPLMSVQWPLLAKWRQTLGSQLRARPDKEKYILEML